MPLQHEVSTTQQTLPTWAYKAILEQLHEGVIIIALDGNYRRMNHAAAILYGYNDPADFQRTLPKPSSLFELRTYPGRKLIPYREWPISRLGNGTKTIDMMAYVKRRDSKRELVIQYHGSVVTNPDGSTSFAILSLYDLTEQVHDRQIIQQSRERLKLAQKAAKIGTFEWQIPADNNIWSEELETLYGLSPGSFGGSFKSWQEHIHPDDRIHVEKLIKETFRTHKRHFETEWRAILPDGTIRSIYAKAEINYDTDGRPLRMLGINMDITHRRNAAAAYQASLDRQSAFFKTALDAVLTIDQHSVITEFNPAAERIFGYSRKEAVGQKMQQLIIPPEFRAAHKHGMGRYLQTDEGPILNKQIEITALRKDGQEFPIELFITRIGEEDPPVFMGTLRDITVRKQQEANLRASEARYAATFNNAPIGIAHTSSTGQFMLINQHFCDMLGYTHQEMTGKYFRDITHPDDASNDMQAMSGLIAGTLESYHREKRYLHKNGSTVWVNLNVAVQKNDANEVDYFLTTVEDITQRRLAEERLREDFKRRQELEEKTTILTEQREQLMMINHAKDEFISLASHQLRTPATGVKQYVGMLMQGYFGDLTDEQMSIVKAAYESNERQLNIVNALLNVARLDAGKVKLQPVSCDMCQMLEDIIQEQAEVFRMRRQPLTLRTPSHPVMCGVDAQLIRMVLENIVDNAGKYSRHGRPVEVRLRQTAKAVIIEVQDQGVGMRQKDHTKLFQKFSRIDNELSTSASGSGLGLYWAKKIMDLHQGTITVDSRARQGSTFTITIPKLQVSSQ